jgi:hypothetical protein
MRRALVCLSIVATLAGCTSSGTALDATPSTDAPSGAITIEALGVSLELPDSFHVVDDPDLELLARSGSPRAILSIAHDSGDVTSHEPEPGESLEPLSLDGVDAVVVTNAVLDGLPVGVAANELLVSNGERSFSMIMSAEAEHLDALWADLMASVAVE